MDGLEKRVAELEAKVERVAWIMLFWDAFPSNGADHSYGEDNPRPKSEQLADYISHLKRRREEISQKAMANG